MECKIEQVSEWVDLSKLNEFKKHLCEKDCTTYLDKISTDT
ncbi:hypothetical protein [Clostridium psychrophilum]|nr:hypothetical protein [Clostridium psychrophilum]